MSWRLEERGSRTITPLSSDTSGIPTPSIPIDETMVFSQIMASGDFVLDSDKPRNIDFGACNGEAHYIIVRVKGGRVDALLSTELGSSVLPVEPSVELRSDNVPFTSLALRRPVGVEVVCNVFLGKRS